MSWVPALVTGGFALLVAVVTAILSWYSQHQAAAENKDRDEQLARLNDRLGREAAEASARRAYEYEARKRLYTEIQPLLFQLGELSEISYNRIVSLQEARVFRLLTPGSYVMLSTIHRLVSPLVVIRQIQRRLTAVDLGVDETVRGQYMVAKEIALALASGERIAETEPQLSYRWTEAERQHIGIGELEQLITLLTVRDADGTRWMDYSELERSYRNDEQARKIINGLQLRLISASPLSKPVVWRTLLVQAYFQWLMISMIEGGLSQPASWEPPGAAKAFNWATRTQPLPAGADAKSARTAALAYVRKHLQRLDSNRPASGQLSPVSS